MVPTRSAPAAASAWGVHDFRDTHCDAQRHCDADADIDTHPNELRNGDRHIEPHGIVPIIPVASSRRSLGGHTVRSIYVFRGERVDPVGSEDLSSSDLPTSTSSLSDGAHRLLTVCLISTHPWHPAHTHTPHAPHPAPPREALCNLEFPTRLRDAGGTRSMEVPSRL
jgi:hypothetical protein